MHNTGLVPRRRHIRPPLPPLQATETPHQPHVQRVAGTAHRRGSLSGHERDAPPRRRAADDLALKLLPRPDTIYTDEGQELWKGGWGSGDAEGGGQDAEHTRNRAVDGGARGGHGRLISTGKRPVAQP